MNNHLPSSLASPLSYLILLPHLSLVFDHSNIKIASASEISRIIGYDWDTKGIRLESEARKLKINEVIALHIIMTKLEKNELNHTMVIEMYDIKNENLPKILSYS